MEGAAGEDAGKKGDQGMMEPTRETKQTGETKGFCIAVDGPAGAGKSTVARAAAARLGFLYADTGALYRAMALYFLRQGIAAEDEAAIAAATESVGEKGMFLDSSVIAHPDAQICKTIL